jgi:hypothetical protein
MHIFKFEIAYRGIGAGGFKGAKLCICRPYISWQKFRKILNNIPHWNKKHSISHFFHFAYESLHPHSPVCSQSSTRQNRSFKSIWTIYMIYQRRGCWWTEEPCVCVWVEETLRDVGKWGGGLVELREQTGEWGCKLS